MRTIMVLNPKGGSGKSTLSTNIASYYASQGAGVALMDFDPQGSAADWVDARSVARAPVQLLRAWQGTTRIPRKADVVVMDVPAAVAGRELGQHLRRAETILVPVLASPMDIRAARGFLPALKEHARIQKKQARFAVVGNRVRENTLVFHELEHFLKKVRVPVLGYLRESMNYLRAAERGIGIFEMPSYQTQVDRVQWEPVLNWLKSKRSRGSG